MVMEMVHGDESKTLKKNLCKPLLEDCHWNKLSIFILKLVQNKAYTKIAQLVDEGSTTASFVDYENAVIIKH